MAGPRIRPSPGFHWIDNEILDTYGTEIGAYGYAIYGVLARHAYSGRCRRLAQSEIASLLGISVSTVARNLHLLCRLQLIERFSSQGDECDYVLLEIKKSPVQRSQIKSSASPKDRTGSPKGEGFSLSDSSNNKEYKTDSDKEQYKYNPVKIDTRAEEIRALICAKFIEANGISFCPWEKHEDVALRKLLQSSPKITLEIAKRCVENYFDSVRNRSDQPRRWIPQLLRFWEGPLDEFGRPLYLTGERLRRSNAAAVGRY